MTLTQKAAVAAAALLAVGGTGAALASTGHGKQTGGASVRMHMGPADDLAAAASYLGISTTELQSDLRSGKTLAQVANATSGKSADGLVAALVAHEQQELAAAVSAGKLTQAQADAISASLQQRVTDLVNGTRPAFPGGHMGHHGPGEVLAAAASYLGTTTSDLLTQLQSGKTLAQVANATGGKSADGLVAALVAQAKQQLAAAVSAGKLTQAQADAISASLQQRVTDLVNGTHPPFGMHPPDGGMPGGMPGGGWHA